MSKIAAFRGSRSKKKKNRAQKSGIFSSVVLAFPLILDHTCSRKID